jgi:DNA helicase-2/ATP-dependent DNA helicase PcrA
VAESARGPSRQAVPAFLELLDELHRELTALDPAEAVARVLDRTGYLRELEREGTVEAEARVENLRELLAGAEDFESGNAETGDERGSLALFLDQVALVSDVDQAELRDDRVSLMTVHSAKGLEFPVVFLVGMEEGIFPHHAASRDERSVEEERRLCYVGMTRAMERLTLCWAQERRRFGSRTYGVPSRFLREIPARLVEQPDGARRAPAAAREERRFDYAYDQSGDAGQAGIAPGLRVRHPVFGPGTVLAVSGAGSGQKLRIRFDRAGVKTVVLRYATLELG